VLENRDNVVVDLMPEGYQFVKFREDVLRYMQEGTYEHTIIAFWEYALLLEVTYKILETDKALHLTNHNLFKPYQQLRKIYRTDEYDREGDFSKHVGKLMESFRQNFLNKYKSKTNISLSTSELTRLLYKHDLSQLRVHLREYLRHKESVWLLIDNIDKGWPTHGLTTEDVLLIRTLVEGARKVERQLSSKELECHSVIMLRNDVYELLVDLTRDRGKDDKVLLDWTDHESLRELLRKRIITNELPREASFDELWHMISVSHVRGEESFQFILDRCLMRPRES
jgi:hypothetical protein